MGNIHAFLNTIEDIETVGIKADFMGAWNSYLERLGERVRTKITMESSEGKLEVAAARNAALDVLEFILFLG